MILYFAFFIYWAPGGEFGSGTALQAGRSRVRFPIWYWDLPVTSFFRPHCGLGVDSFFSNSYEYQGYLLWGKGGRCVGLRILSPACADCLEVLGGASTSWGSVGLSGPVIGYCYVSFYVFIHVTTWPSFFFYKTFLLWYFGECSRQFTVLRRKLCEVKQIVRSAPYSNLISTNRAFVIGSQFMYWYLCSIQYGNS